MYTTCVPVAVALSISSGMIAQHKRIQESSQHMPIATVRLDDGQAAWVESQTTRYRKKADVIRDLIDAARSCLTASAILGKPSAETAAKPEQEKVLPLSSSTTEESIKERKNKTNTRARARDPFSLKQLPEVCLPNDLLDCDQLLREYWAVKKGTRSESVFNRICNKLAAWTPEDRRKALEAAANAGWADVYEPRTTPGQKQFRSPGINPAPEVSPEFQQWLES